MQRRNPQTCELTPKTLPATTLQAGQPRPNVQQTAKRGSTSASTPCTVLAVHTTSTSDASPENTTHRIIPSEDPQRAVEMDDDEDNGSGDGIGEEDGGQDNEDEAGDERNPADDNLLTSDKSPRIRRPIAPWLMRVFKALVAECEHRDARGRPPLYATHKTFWFDQKSSIFLLEDDPLRQLYYTTLPSISGTRRHYIRTYPAQSVARFCNDMLSCRDLGGAWALRLNFTSSVIGIAARIASIQRRRRKRSHSGAGTAVFLQCYPLLLLPSFLRISATAVECRKHYSHGCACVSQMEWVRNGSPTRFLRNISFVTMNFNCST